ncbi:unnamed protein product [Sphenostylis stenocarpa]|uniref:Uncharacterized protein n=1 Tax=Sphenostylis stenocarpa TaxID=92480 RepID=A0AA86SWG0_9FABA|nr:unnamed protein product [Sphenostylis stenocarpa]
MNSERTRFEEVKVEVEKNIGWWITQQLNHLQLLPSTLARLSLKRKLINAEEATRKIQTLGRGVRSKALERKSFGRSNDEYLLHVWGTKAKKKMKIKNTEKSG